MNEEMKNTRATAYRRHSYLTSVDLPLHIETQGVQVPIRTAGKQKCGHHHPLRTPLPMLLNALFVTSQ